MQFLPIIVLGVALYAFMIVPQQRRMKAHQALLRSLEPGDIVVTNAGIHGAIAEVEDAVVWLEVAPEVELKISKAAIAERVPDDRSDDDDEDDVLADADADDSDV